MSMSDIIADTNISKMVELVFFEAEYGIERVLEYCLGCAKVCSEKYCCKYCMMKQELSIEKNMREDMAQFDIDIVHDQEFWNYDDEGYKYE